MAKTPKLEKQASSLRRRVEKLGTLSRGQRYPGELKQELSAMAVKLRRRGDSWTAIGEALGLRYETARRFGEAVRPRKFRAVEVVGEDAAVRIVSPRGWTIEIEDRSTAISLLRELL